jgi:hypothetical protein
MGTKERHRHVKSVALALVVIAGACAAPEASASDSLIGPALLSRLIDYGLVVGGSVGLQVITTGAFGVPSREWFIGRSAALWGWTVATTSIPLWTYHTALVAGRLHGTLGNLINGVRVGTDGLAALGVGTSLARSALTFLGWELAHASMFLPQNMWRPQDYQRPTPWYQYAGYGLATAWLALDIVTIIATDGHKGIADLLLGTRLVREGLLPSGPPKDASVR